MGVESATCLSPQGELSRVPPATEHRRAARRAPAVKPPGPPRAPRAVQRQRQRQPQITAAPYARSPPPAA
jgi:hypothetical protein